MAKVYLIRHAKSEANVGMVYGTDTPLSINGIKQAEEGAKKLNITPDIVISGPKKCHIETAKIMFPDIYNYDRVNEFDEINFGIIEGQKIDDKISKEVIEDPMRIHRLYAGDDIWTRAKLAIAYIERMGQIHPDSEIAIVTAKTLIQAIVCKLVHGEISKIVWSGEYYIRNCEMVTITISNVIDAITRNGRQTWVNHSIQ